MPSSPSSLPSALVLLFAVACGLSVANVYYAQPLLDVLGAEFAIGQAGVGLLFGATQAGCALALLLVVPLGDLLERRRQRRGVGQQSLGHGGAEQAQSEQPQRQAEGIAGEAHQQQRQHQQQELDEHQPEPLQQV
ncbi:hypothetical protein ACV35T_29215, partial [Pseudomonas aeruginosa]